MGKVEEGFRQEEAVGREEDIDKEEDVDKEEDCDKEEDGDKEDDLDKEDAVGKDVKDLVGQVLSASSNGRPPGCRVDGVVAGEELGVDVLVPPSLRSRTRQDQKTGSSQELRESHPMVPLASQAGRLLASGKSWRANYTKDHPHGS